MPNLCPRKLLTCLVALAAVVVSTGCASSKKKPPPATAPLTEPETQSLVMSVSDNLMFAVADACAQVIRRTKRDDSRMMCCSIRLGTAVGAVAAATSQNARVGAADLITLAALQRMALESPRAAETFDEEDRRLLHDTFANCEKAMLERARKHVTEQQLNGLYELINEWRQSYPDRLGMTQVRLEEFATMRQAPTSGATPANTSLAATSVLRLLRIDPMEGLDPAMRQLYESRLFAERAAFCGQRMTLIVGWQVELTSTRLLATGSLKDVVDNTTKFTAATTQFSDATARFASSYDRTLTELPKERAAAIEQADRALDARVKAALDQSAAAVSSERERAVKQVGDEFARRMDALVEHLGKQVEQRSTGSLNHAATLIAAERQRALADAEAGSKRVVDRMTRRLVVVVLIGAVIVAAVAFGYRRLVARADASPVPARVDGAGSGGAIAPRPKARHA